MHASSNCQLTITSFGEAGVKFAKVFKTNLLLRYGSIFGGMKNEANLALMCAALHPHYGHLTFERLVNADTRNAVWKALSDELELYATEEKIDAQLQESCFLHATKALLMLLAYF